MESQELSQLSFKDISIILNCPINKILKNYNTGMKILREAVIRHSTLEPSFTTLQSNNICANCEKIIGDTKLQADINDKNFFYCSKRCLRNYPPKVIEIETKYKNNISTILKWMCHHYKTEDLLKQTLHLDDVTLNLWIKKYLGTTIKKIYKKKTPKNQKL
jgi:hypothetical protein